jgi:hypothetical protein
MKNYFHWRIVLFSAIVCLTITNVMAQGGITVILVDAGAVPTDPLAVTWQKAPVEEVALLPQQMAMPTLAKATIDKIKVQALNDGQTIGWRVAWDDQTADMNVDTGRFTDAVALEFPLSDKAAPMMGGFRTQGGKVQILYWKALWQKDINEGFQDVQDVYPNYWTDLYWFAEGGFPYHVLESFQNPASKQWFVGYQAGNPVSVFSRLQPVEELVAEGWGTLTHRHSKQEESATSGKGVWDGKQWSVVFLRPLKTEDVTDHQFAVDKPGQVAFAVWQGSEENVGGRKHWSNWVSYHLQK